MTQQDIMPGKPLADLLRNKWLPSDVGDATVTGLCLDSRQLVKGDLFVAIPGSSGDGRNFINYAIAGGAAAVIKEADNDEEKIRWLGAVPIIPCVGLARDVSAIAGAFFGDPSRDLNVIGVTGTNGKSTCTHLLAQLYGLLGQSSAVVGTLGYGLVDPAVTIPDNLVATGLTTPDPIANQRILAALKNSGARAVAMEVSSHSLHQHRVADVTFAAALFTNLTRDHLDYHGDMRHYGLAKKKLFLQPGLRHRVINVDDAFGHQLVAAFRSKRGKNEPKTWTYSLADKSADVHLDSVTPFGSGVRADIVTPWGKGQFSSVLLGDFNLSNLLGVIAVCCAQGHELDAVLDKIAQLKPVPGRMEQVSDTGDINVIVDYAHTPDSLHKALQALRPHTAGQLYCVFGCGGDRDRGKRPLMAAVAEKLADRVIVTSDNPRTELQTRIAGDIRAGFDKPDEVVFIDDRGSAITQTIAQAQPGDCILIAGKGHETDQQVGDNRLPFSDVKQARLALQARKRARSQGAADL